jgi:hypothetical protein
MKIQLKLAALALLSAFSLQPSALVRGATTIDAGNHYAYGANVGWMDWRGDVANGVVVGEYVCSGYIYAANVGWINLGSGSPTNGIQYQNLAASDFGLNLDGAGNLRGYAYGANIGWINFEATGVPKVDLFSGRFSGYAYSANCGWVSLSNAFAYVQTDTIVAGVDSDGDGITDAWERTYTNTLTAFTASTDTDGDGMTDKQEYLAGTNPLDGNDKLRMLSITHGIGGPIRVDLTWAAKPTRYYILERRAAWRDTSPWEQRTTGSENVPGLNSAGFDESGSRYFYRIGARRPLLP